MLNSRNRQTEKNGRIYELTTLVAGSSSLQEVLDKLAEAAVKITGVKACSIRLLEEKTGDLKMRSTYGLSEEYRNKGVVSKEDPVIKAAFAGRAVVLDDMRTDKRVQYKEASIKEGLVSQLTVAMKFRGKPVGVLRLYSPRPKRFGDDDINIARAVASQCAVAITNARLYVKVIEGARLNEQLRLAGVIQRRMIPEKAPLIPGLDVAAKYIPCFDVGGDFYDFVRISENCFAIAIADVIGKGIPAAIMMSLFRGAVRAYTDNGRQKINVNEIVRKLNHLACAECRNGEFITLFYAIIDVREMTVTYCSCGHEPTLLFREGKVRELTRGGLVLGVDKDATYETGITALQDGDCLLFYTDGLTDAADFQGRFWGFENMLDVAKKYTADSAQRMIEEIFRFRRRFVGLASQTDDTSIVVVKVDRRAEPDFMKRVE